MLFRLWFFTYGFKNGENEWICMSIMKRKETKWNESNLFYWFGGSRACKLVPVQRLTWSKMCGAGWMGDKRKMMSWPADALHVPQATTEGPLIMLPREAVVTTTTMDHQKNYQNISKHIKTSLNIIKTSQNMWNETGMGKFQSEKGFHSNSWQFFSLNGKVLHKCGKLNYPSISLELNIGWREKRPTRIPTWSTWLVVGHFWAFGTLFWSTIFTLVEL